MALTEEQYQLYLNTHLKLLYYVGIQASLFPPDYSYEKFTTLHFKDKMRCRDVLLNEIELANEYLTLNFEKLSKKEIQVLESFKKHIKSSFIVFKSLKKYAVLLDTNSKQFYAVKPLKDNFKDLLGSVPGVIETTILPFEDFIIYDGFIRSTTISLGCNIIKEIRAYYNCQKQENQIINRIE